MVTLDLVRDTANRNHATCDLRTMLWITNVRTVVFSVVLVACVVTTVVVLVIFVLFARRRLVFIIDGCWFIVPRSPDCIFLDVFETWDFCNSSLTRTCSRTCSPLLHHSNHLFRSTGQPYRTVQQRNNLPFENFRRS